MLVILRGNNSASNCCMLGQTVVCSRLHTASLALADATTIGLFFFGAFCLKTAVGVGAFP